MASKNRSIRRATERFLRAAGTYSRTIQALSGTATVNFAAAAPGPDGQPGRAQPTFDMVAYSGGVLSIGWGGPVYVDLAGLKAADSITILLDHVRDQLVGQGKATITAKQVKVAGAMTGNVDDPNDPAGKVALHARNGFTWPVSIGAEVESVEEVRAGSKAQVNGRNIAGPAIVVRAATLREVSFVSIGGDKNASATVAAAAAGETIMTFEQWIKAQGHNEATLTAEQRAALQASYDGLKAAGLLAAPEAPADNSPAGSPAPKKVEAAAGDEAATLQARLTLVREHSAMIDRVCGGRHADLAAKASKENWTEEHLVAECKLADLRASRPQAPMIGSTGGVPLTAKLAEAALCLAHNVGTEKDLLASYGEQTLDQAKRFRRVRFSKMAEVLAAQGGVMLPMEVGSREWVQAAFSAADLSGILGAVANKALAQILPDPTWVFPQVAGVVSHTNFHTHTVYSLSLDGDLAEVAPTGELDYLSLSEESWTRQVKTRGANLGLPRTDIVNDELGAFVDNARRLVRKAFVGREKAGFALINAAVTSGFFSAAHKNYMTGADTALCIDSLGAAGTLFEEQTDKSGDPVLITPSILLTPTGAVKETARAILAAGSNVIISGLASTSAKSVQSNANVYANAYRLLASPFLKNANLAGYSALAWYLLANPAEAAAFEIAYLLDSKAITAAGTYALTSTTPAHYVRATLADVVATDIAVSLIYHGRR